MATAEKDPNEKEPDELTDEQKKLLSDATKEAEEGTKESFKGFSETCDTCHNPRHKVNNLLLCAKCDFVKFDGDKASADPPKKKD